MNYIRLPWELIAWIAAIALLAGAAPDAHHFTLCPLAALGFTWCPGCGLGRSVSSLLHADIPRSLHYHWFGIPATIILCHRILILSKIYIKSLLIST